MGSIKERQRQDGSTAYLAQIIIKRKGRPTHREAATFNRRSAATAWIKNREAELREPGGVDRAKVKGKTLGDAIARYVDEDAKGIGRTKTQVLAAVKRHSIAQKECASISSADIVGFARELAEGVRPSTVGNYLSHIQSVFAIARPAWGYELDPQIMADAFTVCRRLGYTGPADSRTRRPTLEELDKLMTFFAERDERWPNAAPMTVIIAFAIFSTRRESEIIRIHRKDFEPQHKRALVHDMKHPGQKKGNDVWVGLTDEAVAIMEAMTTTDIIFPYTTDAIGAAFTRACKVLAIEDLRFHDLRHEGVSRLFEMGWDIPRVALVSAHRSWASLQRYSHIRQSGDKFKDWKWLPRVIERARRG
ncbi:hypothetical protein JP74_03000 [Devosia sp. 17-2-E-8]|nr:hypothetical protein JP74_03000 [Devosia sp. 17-2-E-8]